MLKNRLMYIAFLSGMVVFFVFYEGWFARFILLATLLLPLFSILLSLILFRRVRICTDTKTRLLSGDVFSLTVYFTKKDTKEPKKNSPGSLLFPGCRFVLKKEDRLTGRTAREKQLLAAPDYEMLYEEPLHAGVYTFELQHCRLMDLLGLASFKITPPDPIRVTVFPQVIMPSPVPDIRSLLPVSFTPSPTQGFSEITDIRDL